MNKEEVFLNMALDYKKQYKECAWWKFKKRNELYKSWQSALGLWILLLGYDKLN